MGKVRRSMAHHNPLDHPYLLQVFLFELRKIKIVVVGQAVHRHVVKRACRIFNSSESLVEDGRGFQSLDQLIE